MEYDLKDHGLITILRLKGDLTFHGVEDLGSVLHQVVHDTSGEIVVDFSQVGHAEAIVAGQFVAAKREADIQRRDFVLSNLSPSVRKVLHMAHADNLIKVYETSEAAIADLAERARGGEPRRIVPNIECGHSDCVFYTYAKVGGQVTPACEYSYPEEITNGPNCRCYRVNWKQYQANSPSLDTRFPKSSRPQSAYAARDQFLQDPEGLAHSTARVAQHPPLMDEGPEPEEDLEPSFPQSVETFQTAAPPIRPTPLRLPAEETVIEIPIPDFMEDPGDPFADDNFPSTGSEPEILQPVSRSAPNPSAAMPAPVLPPPPKPEPLRPEEVVKKFVEAWNGGRFDWEFECLSLGGGGLTVDEYFSRRRLLKNAQVQKYGRGTHQTVSNIDSVAIQGKHATIDITRLDRTPKGAHCYSQTFSLKLEGEDWRIVKVEVGEIRKNPTVPDKGRTMKAGDFQGKAKDIDQRKKQR